MYINDMENKIIQIKLSAEEMRYAKALSLRSKFRCPRPNEGSVAHGLKSLLHEKAKEENIQIAGSNYFAQ
jgi:hypothetical protein